MKHIYRIIGLRNLFGHIPAKWPALLFIVAALFAIPVSTSAQSGLCDPGVPFFTVDLTASPSGTWISPSIVRNDNCCGTTNPDRCLEFEITLNPGTIAINFNIASGAVPPGSMFYQIDCGPQIPVGTPICLTGPGPFTLTFCKPGNNANTYAITAIPEPSVGPPVYASSTCPASIWVEGLVPGTITWTDITGGGLYNSYLSCTNCASPIVTPAAGHPAYVDYVACGTVEAGACAASSSFCDTVRVFMFDPIEATVNPNPAFFCPSDPGVQLTGSHTGGYGTVVYTWYNSSWTAVGTGTGYFATSAGTYYLVVTDDMSGSCPADTVPVTVTEYIPPILISPAYAGICEGSSVTLTASGADSYVWAPATGIVPTTGAVVVASPATTTTYTVTGTDSHGCTGSMSVMIDIFPLPVIDAGPDQEICFGESAQLQGSGAFSYEWTPAGTLNNPNISNPIATPAVTTTYYLTGYSIGGNLIYNGDFELGNTGFTTDYNYDPNLFPEGNYYITDNPNTHHTNFAACADHTPAPGTEMMVVNGAPIANQEVWCMNVAVVPNTDYAFSTWITSVHPTNPAVLQFSINSVLLGSPFTATATTCNWQQFYEIWNSGASTSAQICIVNQNTIRNGNDFALDDIGFAPLCSNIDSVTVVVNPNPVVTINPVNPQICVGESTTLTATSDLPGTTFLWSNGATTPSITVSPGTTTNYSVTGTANNCTGSASMSVIVNPLPVITVATTDANICVGESTTLAASSDIAGSSFLWSTGGNTAAISVSPVTTTTYDVTVTSPQGCVTTGSVTVNVFPNPVLTVSATSSAICFGDATSLSVVSDLPATSFVWSTGETTSSITVNPTTTTNYTVTGTAANGCTGTASFQIVVYPLPVISVSTSDANICVGESSILTATSDIIGSTFLWSTGANTATISVSPVVTTTYDVTVTSPQGCITTGEVTITVFPNPVLTLNSSSGAICVGDPATLTVSSDLPGTTFIWSTGETTTSISVSPVTTTTYFVTGSAANACTGTASIQIIVNPLPVISVTTSDANICVGESSVLSATSDITGSTFLWSTGESTSSTTVSPATTTTYEVTVTSPEGCVTTGSVLINVFPNPVLAVNASSNAICFGDPTTINVTSNLPATSFVWSSGQTTPTITVSPTATTTYFVTGTAANGCTGTASIEIIVNPLPVITATTSDADICVGESSVLTASSNIPGSTYQWSNGGNTASITVSPLATTTYTVTVTSPEGCITTGSVSVTVFPNPVVSITSTEPEICVGGSTTLSVTSNIAATAYEWSTGATTSSITVNPVTTTTYYVTGTSANGCTGTASFEIIVNPLPVISVTTTDANICVGESSVLSATSDIAGSTFLWSNGGNTSSITVSPVATTTYNVTVTSPEGCITTGSVTITVFPNPVLSVSVSSSAICVGDASTLTVTSDIIGTTYEWSTGETTSNIVVSPVSTTIYTVTGTAANACTGTATVQIIVNPLPIITVATTNANICVGESSTLAVSSNIAGSTFLWSTGGTTAAISVSPVTTTTYNVTVTSPQGCVTTGSVTINVFPNPVLTVSATSSAICFGDATTLSVVSDLPATTFEWSTGETTPSITVNPSATTNYTVTGTAANGCTGTASFQVIVFPLPVVSVSSSDANICVGESSVLTASSNIAGSTYLWSNGANTASITVSPIVTTNYDVTVTSPQGCVTTGTVTITVFPNPVLSVSASSNAICFGDPATITVNSDLPATSYIWSSGQTTPTITVSPTTTTTYIVTGSAANSCTGTASIEIVVNPLPVISVSTTDANICVGESPVLTATSDIAGSTFLWSNGGNTASITVSPVTTTTYDVTVTSPEGCVTTGSVTINVFPNPVLTVAASSNAICFGDPTTINVTSNLPATSFVWSSGQTTPTITVSPTATTTYIVTGTAANGCTGTASIEIIVNPLPVITAAASDADICIGESTVLTATSNIPGSTFAWDNGGNTSSITVSPVATTTYNVTVTSPEGCITTGAVTVTVFPNPVLTITESASVICFGDPTVLTVSSNLSGTAFEWSDGSVSNTITVSPTATTIYTVTGSSANACTGTTSVQIVVNPLPVITVTTSDADICAGESPVLTATSDIAGSTYLWSNGGNTSSITVSPATTTTYNVTVTSPEGCITTGSVTINVFPNPVLAVSASSSAICLNDPTTINVTSSVPSTSFEWSTGGVTGTIVVNPAATTTYFVTGTAANGCTGTASIEIIVNTLPQITFTPADPDICFGESSVLTSTSDIPGSTYLWSNGGNTSSITVSPATTTTYNITVTTPEGCTATGAVTVDVYPNPVLTIATTATAICDGATATLTVSSSVPGTTFEWNTGAVNPTITIGPASTSTYSVTGTAANGCTGTANIQIVVNPLPVITMNVTDSVICDGENVIMTATSDIVPSAFLWSTGAVTPQIMVSPTLTNTYYITVTSPEGCVSTANSTITVNPVPVASVVPSSSAICLGATATLTCNTNIAVTNYLWNTAETNPVIFVSPANTTTYTVTVTTAEGCTGTANIPIQVNPLPAVSITSPSPDICLGSGIDLTASSDHPSTTFLWSTGQNGNSITVTPAATTTYNITGTDINGCTSTAEIQVIVNPLPVVDISAAQNEICAGMSVQLTASSSNPNTNYVWSTGATTQSILVSPPSTATYQVTGTDANGCTGSDRITIQVNPNPTVAIGPTTITICPGDTASLTASSATAIAYAWSTGATTNTISVWPTATTTYSVTGTDNKGCIGVATANVVVRNAPVIVVSPYNPKICAGDSVTLIASGAVLYDWNPPTGLNTFVGNVVVASPDSTTTYTVAGVDLYGCLGSANITVTVHPIPTVDFTADETDICLATVVHFSGQASPSIASWVWDFGDPASGASNSSSMQNPMHAFFETGTYTIGLNVTTTAGCKNAIQKPSYIVVHPNPIASFARTPDITTLEYPTIQFYDQSLGVKSLLWDFDDPGSGLNNNSINQNPTHTYSTEGEYWAVLFVENEWGCMDSVSNRIIINPTWDEYIPTAFSPNGDGNNDVFKPLGFNIDFTQFKMYIYDRWGKEIFDTDNIEEGWDGRVNDHGEIVQQDVYVYLIILTDITGLEHQFIGHVTVVK